MTAVLILASTVVGCAIYFGALRPILRHWEVIA